MHACSPGGGGGGGLQFKRGVAREATRSLPWLCTAGAPSMAVCVAINNTQKLLWHLLENSMALKIG